MHKLGSVAAKKLIASVLVVGSGLLSGCGSSGPTIAPVVGKVLLDGSPLEGVMVEFQPTDKGRPSVGYTDEEGTFKLRYSRERWGALPGTHIVRVDFDHDAGSGTPRPSFKIPRRYNVESELTQEVVKGNNVVELALVTTPADRVHSKSSKKGAM